MHNIVPTGENINHLSRGIIPTGENIGIGQSLGFDFVYADEGRPYGGPSRRYVEFTVDDAQGLAVLSGNVELFVPEATA